MNTKKYLSLAVLLALVSICFLQTASAKDFESSSVPVISSQIPQNATVIDEGHGTVRTLDGQKDYYNADWVLISADGNVICYVTSYDNDVISNEPIFLYALLAFGLFLLIMAIFFVLWVVSD